MASDTSAPERSIGQLVADATHDVQGIFRSEIAMAKAEMSDGAKVMGKGVGMLAGAAVFGLLGLLFLLHTGARLIGEWLPVWVGYLIVTVVVFVIAAVLALVGKKALSQAKPKPERTISEAQQTIAALKKS